jgi:subtilisin family serine protease
MEIRSYKLFSEKKDKEPTESLNHPCSYGGDGFGLPADLKGDGVRIVVVDSGLPNHPDIQNIGDSADMSELSRDKTDWQGHATMVGGILGGSNPKGVVGVCPRSVLLFAKVVNANNECCYNSVVAAVLWSIVKKANIILLSLGSETDHPVLRDAIQKASDNGICIIAAANGKKEYPASYPGVLSVDMSTQSSSQSKINVSNREFTTTYLKQKYIQATGSSLAAALVAGLASLTVEEARKKGEAFPVPKFIYSQLHKLLL